MKRAALVVLALLTGLVGIGTFALAVSVLVGEQPHLSAQGFATLSVCVIAGGALFYRRRLARSDRRIVRLLAAATATGMLSSVYPAWVLVRHTGRPELAALDLGILSAALLLLTAAIFMFANLKRVKIDLETFD